MGVESSKEKVDNTYKLLICPNCCKYIPELTIHDPTNITNNLYLNCQCLKEEVTTNIKDYLKIIETIKVPSNRKCTKHADVDGLRFCIQCCVWLCQLCLNEHKKQQNKLHQVIDFQLNIICSEHKTSFTHFCEHCNLNLCNECRKSPSHEAHHIIEILPIDPIQLEQDFKQINQVISNNNKKIKNFILVFYNECDKMDLESKRQKEKEINEQFETYKTINETYKQFLEYLLASKKFIVANMNYSINNLFRNLKVNLNELQINTADFPSAFVEIKKYLETNYIITIKSKSKDKEKIPKVNRKTNECIKILSNPSVVVSLIQLSNGTIVSASSSIGDAVFRLWDAQTFKCKKTFSYPNQIRYMINLQNDMIAFSSGSLISIIMSRNGKCLHKLEEHESFVTCIIQLKNSNIVSSSDDATIKIWKEHEEKMTCLSTLKDHKERVNCIVEYKDNHIASGADDNMIMFWDLSNESCIYTIKQHTGPIKCLLILPALRLASGSDDHLIMIWDLQTFACLATLTGHTDCIFCLHPMENDWLISGSKDQSIKIWDLKSFACKVTLDERKEIPKCLFYLENGLLLSGTTNNNINIWDI